MVELGGGTGALSMGLAHAGAASVACTDLPCHLARIERTIHANTRTGSCCRDGHEVVAGGDEPAAPSPPVVVQGLRWGEEGDLARVRAHRKGTSTNTHIRSSSSGAAQAGTAPGGCTATEEVAAAAAEDESSAFDMIVLSEVLYWPALDLLQEDTREALRRTLLGLSKPGTKVILIYKER